MLNQGMDVSTYLQMLASQYNTTYTIIKDAYIRCCNETTTGGTTPVNIPCDRVPKDFCRKLMTANTQQAVDAIVNSVSSMFNISYQQAFSLLKRCCRENGTGTGTGTDIPCRYVISHGVCEKYMGHMNNGDVQSAMQEVNQFALSEGISTPAAYALVLKCCGDDTTGTGTGTDYGCDRVPRELCIKYLSGIQNNDQLSITSTVNQLVSMLGVSYTQAQALLRKCCRENGTGTGTSTGSDRDDCDIICYKCQDGYPVANKFNGMRTSKSDGSGYIVDCPKGWSSNTNPCGDRPTRPNTSPVRPTRPNTSPVRPTIPTRPNVSTVKSGGVGTTSLGGGFGSIPRPNTSPIKFGPSNVPTSQTQVMNNTNIATPMRNYSGGMWLSDNY
tara:strand:- start:3383 stop:4537 length:1155 start_codon:yes stop_codon:yes gene_type:complete